VSRFLTDVRETLLPRPGGRHGPLPPLLVGLTVVTGLVDAFSYLVLGHVFVANMTGNVVFLGFALVGAPGFSIAASVVALVSFWLGALVGGRIGARLGQHRGRLLAAAASLQAAFVAVAVILAGVSGSPVDAGYRYPLIVSLALAMGLQNATARRLAVPDLSTTVLTLTITGIAADKAGGGGAGPTNAGPTNAGSPSAGPTNAGPPSAGPTNGRRLVSVSAMIVGAVVGAVFVLHVAIVLPLVTALVLLVAVAVTARLRSRTDAPWVHP
jgi:uncharacterized membrane protein YoaK (UPF0700 family)